MLVGSVIAAVGFITFALDQVNTLKEKSDQDDKRERVVIRDGVQAQTVEACEAEFLFTDEELRILNDPSASKESKGAVYVAAQERTEANPDWRAVYERAE